MNMHRDHDIPGWFPAVNRNHLIWLMRKHDVRIVLEVGAFLGKSTVFFAQRAKSVYSVDYWSIDCLKSEDEQRYALELGLPREFRSIWADNVLQAMNSRGVGENFGDVVPIEPGAISFPCSLDRVPDLVYLDGDHSYEAVWDDIHKYHPLARKVLCGDDYGVAPGVTRAVTERFPLDMLHIAGPFWWIDLSV
jgi:hypothetical protein